jgi:alpha-tubulin suppressor-like RCC1 family protein
MVTINLDPRVSAGAAIWRLPEKAIAVAAGGQHNLVLTESWRVFASGSDERGQADVPGGLADVVAIAAGYAHSRALRRDGTVAAWGNNTRGATNVPAGLDNVVAISGGGGHSAAVRRDGTVVVWGQLGQGSLEPPAHLTDAVSVASGWECCFAIRASGGVTAWGETQLGSPYVPASLTDVAWIDGGGGPSPGWVAARKDGTVDMGRLHGAAPPEMLEGITQVSAGEMHVIALRRDGTVIGWGNSAVRHTVPSGLGGVSAICAGNDHSLALRADGSVVAWGKNGYQQLQGPEASTAEFVEWEGDGYYLRSMNSRIDPYEADYGRRTPSVATSVGAGTDTSFEGFVDRRLSQQPRPTGGDAKSPRYWVGAGEVMLDILLAATSPSNSDMVLNKIHQDMARGDSVARAANGLLELWGTKSAAGATTSMSETVPDELAPTIVSAYRALTLLYAAAADADRLATIDAVLSRRMTGGDALPSVLKVMLDDAVKDLSGLANQAVRRAVAGTGAPAASQSKPSGGGHGLSDARLAPPVCNNGHPMDPRAPRCSECGARLKMQWMT